MRSARSERVGYRAALSSWFFDNRLNLSPTDRAMLFKVREIRRAVEAWRETLPPMRRLRMNHPGTVLKNYKKAIGANLRRSASRHRHHQRQHERDDNESHSRGIRLEPHLVTLVSGPH